MERDMKKRNRKNLNNTNPGIYSSSLVHLETLKRTGQTLGSFLNPSEVKMVKKNDTVCESILLVDVKNGGISSSSIVRIIHDSEQHRFNPNLIQKLLMVELHKFITSDQNKSTESLNHETEFTLVMCKSSLLNPDVLNQLEEYLKDCIKNDVNTLLQMESEFKKVG